MKERTSRVYVTSEKARAYAEQKGNADRMVAERDDRRSIIRSPEDKAGIETHPNGAQMTLGQSLRNELAGGAKKSRDYF